ncbi:MAG: hypothetical protein HRT43_10770 [Campylobacteraceae bacterium]|nr:hypothetical protein [Campylobacteraceae bacterium]
MDVIIVMVLIFAATAITFKTIKSFYLLTYSSVVSTIIAAITSVMMFFSGMILFYPKDYQRGSNTSEVDLTIPNVALLVVIVCVIYYFFKYRPSQKH